MIEKGTNKELGINDFFGACRFKGGGDDRS